MYMYRLVYIDRQEAFFSWINLIDCWFSPSSYSSLGTATKKLMKSEFYLLGPLFYTLKIRKDAHFLQKFAICTFALAMCILRISNVHVDTFVYRRALQRPRV